MNYFVANKYYIYALLFSVYENGFLLLKNTVEPWLIEMVLNKPLLVNWKSGS